MNKDNFISSLLIYIYDFYFSPYPIFASSRTSGTMLNRIYGSRHTCIASNIMGKAFSLSQLYVNCRLVVDVLEQVEDVPFYS